MSEEMPLPKRLCIRCKVELQRGFYCRPCIKHNFEEFCGDSGAGQLNIDITTTLDVEEMVRMKLEIEYLLNRYGNEGRAERIEKELREEEGLGAAYPRKDNGL
jgi:hypothetical protein